MCFQKTIYLAALGLHCYTQAFSSCEEWGLLSRCGVWASCGAPLVAEHGL